MGHRAEAMVVANVLFGCARTPPPSDAPDAPHEAMGALARVPSDGLEGTVPDASLDRSDGLPPLGGEWIERWTMPSGRAVFVTRPQGATGPRPIVLAVHGAEDRADWASSDWRATTAGFAWVLCPQGVPLRSAYAWPSADVIAKQAFEARDALRDRYGSYVAPGPLLYGGFSQGASLAS